MVSSDPVVPGSWATVAGKSFDLTTLPGSLGTAAGAMESLAGCAAGVVFAAGSVAFLSLLAFAEDVSGMTGSGLETPVLLSSLEASRVAAACD